MTDTIQIDYDRDGYFTFAHDLDAYDHKRLVTALIEDGPQLPHFWHTPAIGETYVYYVLILNSTCAAGCCFTLPEAKNFLANHGAGGGVIIHGITNEKIDRRQIRVRDVPRWTVAFVRQKPSPDPLDYPNKMSNQSDVDHKSKELIPCDDCLYKQIYDRFRNLMADLLSRKETN